MNNKSRIIIGVVIAVLFVIGIVALVQTQTDVTNSTKITNQNDTQIQNNSTDTIEMESLTIVKYTLNNDKSSKVNTNSENKSVNLVHNNYVNGVVSGCSFNNTISSSKVIIRGSEDYSDVIKYWDNAT